MLDRRARYVNRVLAAVLAGGAGLALAATAAPADPAAQMFERPYDRSRDGAFNRVVARGPALSALRGAAAAAGGAGAAAAATANAVSVTQSGRGHTLVLSVEQTNTGAISAGAVLNGRLE